MTEVSNPSFRERMNALLGLNDVPFTPNYKFDMISKTFKNMLEPLLISGYIALINSRWLFDNQQSQILPRQDLPPEAFVSFHDLEKMAVRSSSPPHKKNSAYGFIVAISHMWLDAKHPDLGCTTLEIVQREIAVRYGTNRIFGIFWDYMSLYQHPDPDKDMFRTKEQDLIFKRALSGIPYLFLHPDSHVVLVTEFPSSYKPRDGHSATPYLQRGWTCAEYAWTTLVKASTNVVYGQDHKRIPLLPDLFDKHVAGLSFSNGKDDRPLVKRLYRESFQALFLSVRYLDYSNLNWDDSDGQHIANILRRGFAPNLMHLDLTCNNLGSEFCRELASALQVSRQELSILDLSNNPLGDSGVQALAPHLHRMTVVNLSTVGLTALSCRMWADHVSDKRDHNEGDMDAARCTKLNLSYNCIRNGNALECIIDCVSSLKHLDLWQTQIDDTTLHMLKAKCDELGVVLSNELFIGLHQNKT